MLDFARFLSIQDDREDWQEFGRRQLAHAFGEDEPEYGLADIRPELESCTLSPSKATAVATYTSAHKIVHTHVRRRVRRWLRRKFESNGQGYDQYPERELGLLNIRKLPRRYSWAKP
ncbi:MAG: hypothetical protein WCJ35_13480 [Planctomycetota bacterium]